MCCLAWVATALGISDLIAGNTTACVPTMLWHAGLPRKRTHSTACLGSLVPTQMPGASPLNMLQLPFGPAGCAEYPTLTPLVAESVEIVQSPSIARAALPAWNFADWPI